VKDFSLPAPEQLQHNRIRLALHNLRGGQGRPLLLLHGLGERAPQRVDGELAAWPGPIYALDFTGHGASTVPKGGGYTCELLMADADVALARLGEATVVGRGLGAYIALLLAGGRPTLVRGAVLRDGPGLAGGGSGSMSSYIPAVDAAQAAPPDPFALAELATDIRPPDYACIFARQAAQFSQLARPISVCACERPGWLAAVVNELGVEVTNVREALEWYAQARA
jgi:pimeloyl-ACP methyl ester carboxylesterase